MADTVTLNIKDAEYIMDALRRAYAILPIDGAEVVKVGASLDIMSVHVAAATGRTPYAVRFNCVVDPR